MMNHTAARIVEIVGLAGAGKTTLFNRLRRQNGCFFAGNFPDVREISDAPFFICNGLQVSPAILRLPKRNSRNLTRREFAWLSILHGWPGVLRKEANNHKLIVLDQGPVYLLTEVRAFGPEYLREPEAEKLWQALYSRWYSTLDTIVWLDAADSDLQRRIRNRDKGHVIKNESDETTYAYLARFRQAYERTISELKTGDKNLRIIRFDTSQSSVEEIVNRLLLEFGSAQ